jgi:hypothetical protein
MRRHKVLLVTAFLIITEIVAASLTANAQQKAVDLMVERNAAINEARLRLLAHKGNEPLEQAFQDAISILSKNNSCSRFYGDTKAAEEILRRLATQFRLRLLRDSRTGIEMSGTFTYFDQTEKHSGYRLFAAATINTRGPFLKAKVFPAEPYVPSVGSFLPNTREARVLMLLHELAHLVKSQAGNWLIPDDGNAPALSKQNTALIESQCRTQILSLSQKADERLVWNITLWRSNWS